MAAEQDRNRRLFDQKTEKLLRRNMTGNCPRDAGSRKIEGLLRHALEFDEFQVYYQPLYTIFDGTFTEAEALLRLRGEDGRFISPDIFIPVAEECGLISKIGLLVLDKVCRYIRYLLDCKIDVDSISVNLSAIQLLSDSAVADILEIIRRNCISPNRILLEVTESRLICNFEEISLKIKKLSAAGVQFALDDFGTGYSNIANVIDLPFDVVKIDKSLIWNSMDNTRSRRLVGSLTSAFRDINLEVTAEGVETEEQADFARMCRCDKIQGFLYARPMPVSRAEDFFGCGKGAYRAAARNAGN